jgi:RIO-like serine/threonine protein kinase
MDYFSEIIDGLKQEDLLILNELYTNESTCNYKSITKQTLSESITLSTAIYRKTLGRLETLKLINITTGSKNHSVYLTDYGMEAINLITEGANV